MAEHPNYGERARAHSTLDGIYQVVDEADTRIVELQAHAAAMRKALELADEVAYIGRIHVAIVQALSSDAGKELLAKLGQAEQLNKDASVAHSLLAEKIEEERTKRVRAEAKVERYLCRTSS